MANYPWPLTSAGSLSQPPGMLNYDWPLTWAGLLSHSVGMLNFYWLLAHNESHFQSSRKENSDWWLTQAASPFSYTAVTSVGSCEGRLGVVYSPCCWERCRDLLKGQGRSGHRGIEMEEERGHRSQFKYLSNGGRVTSPPRKTTRRPWRVRKYWRESDEWRKIPSNGSNHQIAAHMECRKRFWPGRAICPWSAKREDGSSILGSTSTSCLTVLKY